VILAEEAGLDSLMSLLNHEHVKIRALAEESLNALKKSGSYEKSFGPFLAKKDMLKKMRW